MNMSEEERIRKRGEKKQLMSVYITKCESDAEKKERERERSSFELDSCTIICQNDLTWIAMF